MRWMRVALVGLVVVGCGKDPRLRAARSECEAACTRVVALSGSDRGGDAASCAETCLARGWTVGDATCLLDAASYPAAKDCAALAALISEDAARRSAEEEAIRKRGAGARPTASGSCECPPGDPLCRCP